MTLPCLTLSWLALPSIAIKTLVDIFFSLSYSPFDCCHHYLFPLCLPLSLPLSSSLFLQAPKGVLLYGPPGTGKTLLARACAKNTEAVFLKLAGTSYFLVEKNPFFTLQLVGEDSVSSFSMLILYFLLNFSFECFESSVN